VLVVTDRSGAVDTLDYTVRADTLAMTFRRVSTTVDLNFDGVPDPARVTGRLLRRR
jgi:hypothetical protein